ncbi:helix-turn-helix domain-containing protein [Paenibacillus oleatilyticus]|uniref:helix-turn-helix domain-containing protein n=1 Tax=Paenibacillus oleatilyticus TaxID=2594886 RepID=UPI001C1FA5B1|nr:helix-turn-helix domain-containing protein [Paenibacillus oleatilyticus]MBU7318999.1 helix-turn-helix domain-containing protein [Paenibacillus oleatilyticus]
MKEQTDFKKDTLEVSDIRKILGCGLNQAYKLVHSGVFHSVRVGRGIKINRESFYNWYNGTKSKQEN